MFVFKRCRNRQKTERGRNRVQLPPIIRGASRIEHNEELQEKIPKNVSGLSGKDKTIIPALEFLEKEDRPFVFDRDFWELSRMDGLNRGRKGREKRGR